MIEKTVTGKDLLSEASIYKQLIDEMEDYSIILLDTNGNIKSWNRGAEKIKGYLQDEIVGENFRIFYSKEDQLKQLPEHFLEEAIQKGKVVTEGWRIKKDGSLIWVHSVLNSIHDTNGHLIGFAKIIRDFTEKKKLDDQSRFLSNIVHNIHDPIISTNTDFIITQWNPAAAALLGWTEEEAIGKYTRDILKATYPDKDVEEIRKAYFEKGYWQGEGIFQSKSGEPVNVLITASYLKEKDGKVIGSVVLAKDITQRKKAEQALEKLNNDLERRIKERTQEIFETNRRFQSLVENDYTITLMVDPHYNTIYRSPSAEAILGWTEEERRSMPPEMLIHPDEMEMQKSMMGQILANPNKPMHFIFRTLHKKGHFVWVESVAVNRLHDPGIRAIVVNMHDITERKKSEENIRTNEEKYRLLIERISDGFIALDKDFRYTYANKKIGELTGIIPETLIGKVVWDVFPQAVGSETYNAFHLALKEQKYIYNVDYYEQLDLWQENHIYPSPDGLSVFIRDISERKRAEIVIKQLNESLEERVKLRTAELTSANKALESFSYMVSHDLQSPLRTLNGFTNIILDKYSATFDKELKELFSFILSSSKRMNSIIDDLLKLAKFGNARLSVRSVNMTALFQKVWDNLTQNTNTSAKLKLDTLPDVHGDESMLEQVIINLLSNAIKYSSKTAQPLINVGYTDSNGAPTFYVKDNGVGFSMEHYNKLFAAFQRLHSREEYEGTGIGLLLVKRIIENHGGNVWAESKVNQGATFYFTLPEKK